MPSTLPFDHPSLVLGHVVNTELLALLEKLGALQAKSDAAFDKMNSFIALRRGLSMTINEMVGLGVDIAELKARMGDLDQRVSDAARDYMVTRVANDSAAQKIREDMGVIDSASGLESPLDLTGVQVARLPLGADSIRMDVQYFSYGSNDDTTASALSGIENAIRESVSSMGPNAREIARTAGAQIEQQRKHHNVSGTLVITASCTHRETAVLDPLNIDVDRAIEIWNRMHGTGADALGATGLKAMQTAAKAPSGSGDKSMTLLVGAHYGSSFVGMVHMVNQEMAGTGLLAGQEEALQEQMRLGGWLQAAAGGFGVDESVVDNVRKLLSTQSVSTHANVIALGVVPTFSSAQLQMGVAKVLDDQSRRMGSQAEVAHGLGGDGLRTVQSGADAALKGSHLMAMQGGMMQNLIQGLGKIDQGANRVMDLNSLMNAFTNYLEQVRQPTAAGVPVSFLFRKITRAQLARLWLDKYYPSTPSPTINTGN
ncbi:hypothetical protein [Hydrogenophaga sp.]|uniref:hypothetical protein n=1 Tax=Hydrogenophaga sp. TaxID=1904254 RepID=UPI003D12500D